MLISRLLRMPLKALARSPPAHQIAPAIEKMIVPNRSQSHSCRLLLWVICCDLFFFEVQTRLHKSGLHLPEHPLIPGMFFPTERLGSGTESRPTCSKTARTTSPLLLEMSVAPIGLSR